MDTVDAIGLAVVSGYALYRYVQSKRAKRAELWERMWRL